MSFEVVLTKDYLEHLSRTPAAHGHHRTGVERARRRPEVKVEFARNELGAIEQIRVADNGHGMLPQDIERFFAALRGLRSSRSEPHRRRALHGRNGQGRYKVAGIGSRIIWRTVAADTTADGRYVRTDVELRFTDGAHGETSEPDYTDEPNGTRVTFLI